MLKHDLPMYHVNRKIEELGTDFGDGSHIVYVNGAYKDDADPVGRLMHYFRCTSAIDMFYDELAEPVRFFKETEGGQYTMCRAMEERINKANEITRIDTLTETIKSLMDSMKWTAEQAMTAMKISDADKSILIRKI